MRSSVARIVVVAACVFVFVGAARAELSVQIQDYWGQLSLKHGQDPKSIRCQASEASPDGDFVWSIGDTTLQNNAEKIEIEEDVFEQTLSLTPKIEHNSKALTCRYVERDERGGILEEAEDHLTLVVSYLRLAETANAGDYVAGERAELAVEFDMFPRPKDTEVKWILKEKGGGEEESYYPGESSEDFEAEALELIGPNKYRATFVIKTVQMEDANDDYQLSVHQEEGVRNCKVRFRVLRERPAGPPQPQTPAPGAADVEVTTVAHPKEAKLGVGIFIIVAIIVLILAVCVAYCVYQRCCRKQRSNANSSAVTAPRNTSMKPNSYQPAPTREDQHPA